MSKTRKEKELALCYFMVDCAMKGNTTFFDCFKHDWNAIYEAINTEGWDRVSDLCIDLVYQWANDKFSIDK